MHACTCKNGPAESERWIQAITFKAFIFSLFLFTLIDRSGVAILANHSKITYSHIHNNKTAYIQGSSSMHGCCLAAAADGSSTQSLC